MKALFCKEFRQGRALLIVAAALAVLIALYGAVIAHANPYYQLRPEHLDETLGWLLISLPVGLAFFAGAGLFAAEQDRGTVPLLLGLPLSRRQVWGAKVLAGLALAVASGAILLLLARVLRPGPFTVLPFAAYVPDLLLWSLSAFSAAVFASVLVGHTTGAIGLGAILTGLVAGAAACLWAYLGAPLLWYSEALDTALWAAAAVPGLLLGSALALARGESLGSLRKWRVGGLAFLAALVVAVLGVSGVARVATRYDRRAVVNVDLLHGPDSAGPVRALALQTQASPIRLRRAPVMGWRPMDLEAQSHLSQLGTDAPFRAQYQVVLDPMTGRELLHLPAPGASSLACSPDGRYAAAIVAPRGLTWGARHSDRRTLRIFDLRSGRQTYAGSLDFLEAEPPGRQGNALVIGWSARGDYLIVQGESESGTTHFLTREGREVGTAVLRPRPSLVTWSPTEEVAFGFDSQGRACRVSPEAREPQVIWTPPTRREDNGSTSRGPFGQMQGRPRRVSLGLGSGLSISPDGRWLLVSEYRELETQTNDRHGLQASEQYIWVVPAQGGPARLLWHRAMGESSRLFGPCWSADGKALYALDGRQLLAWRPGQDGLTPTGASVPIHDDEYPQLLAGAKPGELVVWIRQWIAAGGPTGRKIVGARALRIDAEGKPQSIPLGREAKDTAPIGLDTTGRLLVSNYASGGVSGRVQAMDLARGDTRELYP